MRTPLALSAKAWHGPGNGALFSHIQSRISTITPAASRSFASSPIPKPSLRRGPPNSAPSCLSPPPSILGFATAGTTRHHGLQQPIRMFTVSRLLAEATSNTKSVRQRKSYKDEIKEKGIVDMEEHDGEAEPEEQGFAKSEK